ncbi:isocitrate dehydrogenase [Frondihabitans sp. PAMC 28766]|uniref:NADP-dependent isocitrate dehydrogenase n=1 Tax=Frondihabitans sp. PAMC 28766 TaxID=1795630 RepID=UPI00078C2138|nr:NADP-dependent isocitrate dehydrogenase [Frondihabitans sp. PAMC 28766]AMM20994.1 isocitrate dehydrogenase [Frondihabitans sp. PAMC 28766]
MHRIIYTLTDESPRLATAALLPIMTAFAAEAGVQIDTADISLAARILSTFPEHLDPAQRRPDALADLKALIGDPAANIVKLPNISASLPQLQAAIGELQRAGFAVPDYPEAPADATAQVIRGRYDALTGSAVNPVLRQGNSDRRAPASVKAYAHRHPHAMGAWDPLSRTNVATMSGDDFRATEASVITRASGPVTIELIGDDGTRRPLREPVALEAGDVVDAAVLRVGPLEGFLAEQVARASRDDVLFSVHLKATMMKVSDPIIFGHAIRTYFHPVFDRYGTTLDAAGINADEGLAALFARLKSLPEGAEIRAAFDDALRAGPAVAMVDVERGITNFHVPSDVIVDASMPAMIRWSGRMTGPDGSSHDTVAVIPDSSYAHFYQTVLDDCRRNGAFDPATLGTVPNVGLMAGAAEEYGSQDTTFAIPQPGLVRVSNAQGETLLEHRVDTGDIWRLCRTHDDAVRDWVGLAVDRARATGAPTIFWLDPARAHDTLLAGLVRDYLARHETDGLEIDIMAPVDAMTFTLARFRRGDETVSVTGNVLRDYLTDLFPIMELGTSAKMLSIVPLLAGGGLFETGAGGTAPRLVDQLLDENHFRWDSLGEYLAVAASFDHLAGSTGDVHVRVLADTLDRATARFLEANKSPADDVGTIDNRGSHLYLALYWAQELSSQTESSRLRDAFAGFAEQLSAATPDIGRDLLDTQGGQQDIGGRYLLDAGVIDPVMRPSSLFNSVLDALRLTRSQDVR